MANELKLLNNSSSHYLVNNLSSHLDFEYLSQNFKWSGKSVHRHSRSGNHDDAHEFCLYNQMFFYKQSYTFWSRFRYFSSSLHNLPCVFLKFCSPRRINVNVKCEFNVKNRECLRNHSSQRLMIKCLTINPDLELEFRNVGFWGEGKTGVPGKKPRSRVVNQQQTQPTYDAN